VDEVGDCRRQFERFPGEVIDRTGTGGAVGDLAGIGFGISDEFFEGAGRHGGMDRDGEGGDRDIRNRIQVLDRIVLRPALEDRLDHVQHRAA
jgi:hypothetical protein